MIRTKLIVLCVAALALAGCATATPYQAAGDYGRGYTEKQIETNRYRVSFIGNSLTRRETVDLYMLYRAAEITVENGYDYFILTKSDSDDLPGLGYGGYGGYGYGGYGHHGHHGYYGGYGYGGRYGNRSYYDAVGNILVFKGEKPADNVDAHDARDVLNRLGPDIVRPEDLPS